MTRAIDELFTSFRWEEDKVDPIIDELPFARFMEQVDMHDRWIYRGSRTIPPCDVYTYWNIPARIFPLKPEYLKLFQK